MRCVVACALLLLVACTAASSASAATQINAVQGLIMRLIPSWSSFFELNITSSPTGEDFFNLENSASGIAITGNSGVSLAMGLNWYLKYYVNCSVSWGWDGSGNQLSLPPSVPVLPSSGVSFTTPNKYRYYMNVCTVSYSMVWWDITRWQQEVDWMALNGINMPLAFTGQEYVWHKVWSSFGIAYGILDQLKSEDQMDFTGPAFLAWGRMGNIRNWANPLPSDWRDSQRDLGRQILQMTRDYGMTNVLPCFGGHVPAVLQQLFPSANITLAPNWGNFNYTYNAFLLDPTDPLFFTIGKKMIEEVINTFGTDHIYNCDTFNEMDPPTNSSAYLKSASQAVIAPIRAADPNGIWLMQGWLFQSPFWNNVTAPLYLSGVPNDQMIILDLWAEEYPVWDRFNSYYGKPFIWCMLHNFGGNRAIYGNLTALMELPIVARTSPGSTMIGTGLTMEAIEHNPVVYEFMNEMGWRSLPFNISEWISQYAVRRYGGDSPSAAAAWALLLTSHYSTPYYQPGLLTDAPSIPTSNLAAVQDIGLWPQILQYMQLASEELDSLPQTYNYDLVDFTRQFLADTFNDLFVLSGNASTLLRNSSLVPLSAAALGILKDMDAVLNTDENFLLGQWISRARSWASESSSEADQFEFNARNQLTLWGPDGQISDYAAKQWGGLVADYYYMRWSMYWNALLNASTMHTKFHKKAFQEDLLAAEQIWGYDTTSYPTSPQGDTVEAVLQILTEYVPHLQGYAVYNDAAGYDLSQAQTTNIQVLAWLCNQEPACLGNSNGHFKWNVTAPQTIPSVTLFIKQ